MISDEIRPWDFLLYASDPDNQVECVGVAPVVYWLHRSASDAACEFQRLVRDGVPDAFAQLAITTTGDFMVALECAELVTGDSYAEWSRTVSQLPVGVTPLRRVDEHTE